MSEESKCSYGHKITGDYFLIKRFKNNQLQEDSVLCYSCFEFSAFCNVEQIKRLNPKKYKIFKQDAVQQVDKYAEHKKEKVSDD